MRRLWIAGLLLAHGLAAHAADARWDFDVLLDGEPIGTHRFSVSPQGDEQVVRSEASLSVRFLGIVAYRYQHESTERWRGDCLTALDAATNDDGQRTKVEARTQGNGLRIDVDGQTAPVTAGCLMSFAYWNPALRTAAPARLLNVQNGRLEAVQVTRLPDADRVVRGVPQRAQHWRIDGLATPIELWYSDRGDWLGLQSKVRGNKILHYRLR